MRIRRMVADFSARHIYRAGIDRQWVFQNVVIHVVHDHVFAADRAGGEGDRIEIQGAAIRIGIGRAVAFGDGNIEQTLISDQLKLSPTSHR